MSFSAMHAAFTKKPMKPSRTPCFFSNRSLYLARASITALISTSLNVVSIAALFCASFSRRAIVWRRRVMRTRSSLRPVEAATDGVATGVSAAGALTAVAAAVATSSLVSRPSLPVPLIVAGSTPCSSTARRTDGESAAGASALAAGAGAVAGAAAAAGVAAATPSPASTVAIIAPTCTVSPTCTACCPITPATGEGTSTETLSVSRLAIGSSAATLSPGCLSHSPRVASVIDSPSVGTRTSVAILNLVIDAPAETGATERHAPGLPAFFAAPPSRVRRISSRTLWPSASATSAPCSAWWRFISPVAGDAAAARPA